MTLFILCEIPQVRAGPFRPSLRHDSCGTVVPVRETQVSRTVKELAWGSVLGIKFASLREGTRLQPVDAGLV